MTNTITIDGRLTSDGELRFTPQGRAVFNCTVAHNTRRYNKDTQQWEDGDATFIDVALWGKKGENIAEVAAKGAVVVVSGSLVQKTWEDRDGGRRSKHVINADTIALVPTGNTQGGQGRQAPQQAAQQAAQPDPWDGQPVSQQPVQDDPPF